MIPCCPFGISFLHAKCIELDSTHWLYQPTLLTQTPCWDGMFLLVRPWDFSKIHLRRALESSHRRNLQMDPTWLGQSLDSNWGHVGASDCSPLGKVVVRIPQEGPDSILGENVRPVIYPWRLWVVHTWVGHSLPCRTFWKAGRVCLDRLWVWYATRAVAQSSGIGLGFILTVASMRKNKS